MNRLNKYILMASAVAIGLVSPCVVASSTQTLGDVANQVANSMSGVARLITAISYVAGIGFALMGMFKLKAHKDNPQQVPMGQPIVLLLIATGLIFLPNLINTGGATLWGESANYADSRSSQFDFDRLL